MQEPLDPNGPGHAGHLFGLPYRQDEANLVILPIPWEVTVSSTEGTAQGPNSILQASSQVDLHHLDIEDVWKLKMAMATPSEEIIQESHNWRSLARKHIMSLEERRPVDPSIIVTPINQACESLNVYVRNTTRSMLQQNKLVGIVGGDHSVPLGFIQALSERFDRFGILQIDAHCDLRKAYENFTFSHGSIMYNALKLPAVSRIVQVGVRDVCDEEIQNIQRAHGRVKTYFDQHVKERLDQGDSWSKLCDEIVEQLPESVYVSFDIDGLDPKLCPHTGTPVPGGLEFQQAVSLIRRLVEKGTKIIGFDLCEVAPQSWDASVGARILFQLCSWTAVSHNLLKTRTDHSM